ncbi:Zn(II)2Cys6 transcription factor [Aspergillus mulundensis]|uniref:Zn(2)-C6 fungal-type domain-containing protein n=1 Tax=Aspergillus mulundensis TaxID=1810919 RepID=A0A3D8T502_9EURO|nr:hypothetical protein DSM5745_00955 [Aspergillus mulundensis]RDW93633.1 hypothetical protein DSM5745_00955 [Aspergillus mulundensis]
MPQYKTSNLRRRTKSRAGCLKCKQRRIKCDLRDPACAQCEKVGLSCPGYKRGLRWSYKHELLRDEQPVHQGNCGKIRKVEKANKLPAPITAGIRKTSTRTAERKRSIVRHACFRRTTSPVPHVYLEIPTDQLLRHYFTIVCSTISAHDSPQNPFRCLVAALIPTYPPLLHAVLALSAAHLQQHEKYGGRQALEYKTEAMSMVAAHISHLNNGAVAISAPSSRNTGTTALLLTVIFMGIISKWNPTEDDANNATIIDTLHLQGARAIFKHWIVGTNPQLIRPAPYHLHATFFVGILACWEAFSSFYVDQDLNTVDYLWAYAYPGSEADAPNPYTGISTSLFIYMAKVGTISRQLHRLKWQRLETWDAWENAQEAGAYLNLLQKAQEIEDAVRGFPVPRLHDHSSKGDHAPSPAQEAEDPTTWRSGFCTLSRVYRLCILLELYRVFPELIPLVYAYSDTPPATSSYPSPRTKPLLLALATQVIALLMSLPKTPGTKAIPMLPLIVAGSALQRGTESNSAVAVMYGRSVVSQKLSSMSIYCSADSVDQAKGIVEGVWMSADHGWNTFDTDVNEGFVFVDWTDFIMEKGVGDLAG